MQSGKTARNHTGIDMHYPSYPTCDFATGQWISGSKVKNAQFQLCPVTQKVSLYGTPPSENHLLGIFQANFNANDSLLPSKVIDKYWIQAPLTEEGLSRLPNITCNSGKFLIFVTDIPLWGSSSDDDKSSSSDDFPKQSGTARNSLDNVWHHFKKVYAEGGLGYAIQCSTAKPSPHAQGGSAGLITVHIEDCFDIENVINVSYKIFQTYFDFWADYKGTLQVMTDRAIQAKCGYGNDLECKMLFSISSQSYLDKSKRFKRVPKTLENYSSTLHNKLISLAQQRQNEIVGIISPKVQSFPKNSGGRFLVFVPKAIPMDLAEAKFSKMQIAGGLGDTISYSATQQSNSKHNVTSGLITVHILDRFDINKIADVSYNIFSTCYEMENYTEGVLQFYADSSNNLNSKKPLFSISSRTYMQWENNVITSTPKSLENFAEEIGSKVGPIVNTSKF